jgi:N-acetylglutamate synthase
MTLADYDQAFALWQACEGIGLTTADSCDGIRAYLGRNPGLSFVARDQGCLVGTVLCGHDGRRGYLHHLAVAPSHRGQGLGRALVAGCLAKLAAAGIDRCHLWARANNREGQAFWRTIGWTERTDLVMMSRQTRSAETVRKGGREL